MGFSRAGGGSGGGGGGGGGSAFSKENLGIVMETFAFGFDLRASLLSASSFSFGWIQLPEKRIVQHRYGKGNNGSEFGLRT